MGRVALAIAALAPLGIAYLVRLYVGSVYAAARAMPVNSHVTGGEAAYLLLHATGNLEIKIESVAGDLTDHFDAAAGVIRLTPQTHGESSVAALAIVGHEMGHVAQYQIGSYLLFIRSVILRAAEIASNLGLILMMVGVVAAIGRFGPGQFALVGGFLSLGLSAALALVTLPLEFDASRRALRLLVAANLLTADELPAVRRVLTAAALSYAAAAIMAMSRLPYLLGRGFRR